MEMQFDNEQEKDQEQKGQTYGGQLEFKDADKPADQPDLPEEEEAGEPVQEEEDGQLGMFNDMPEADPIVKKTTKKATASDDDGGEKKKKAPQVYGKEYSVYYAGHHVEVPHDNMTLEDIRKHLESDFPEMTKERASLQVDVNKKHIVPVISGAKKG